MQSNGLSTVTAAVHAWCGSKLNDVQLGCQGAIGKDLLSKADHCARCSCAGCLRDMY